MDLEERLNALELELAEVRNTLIAATTALTKLTFNAASVGVSAAAGQSDKASEALDRFAETEREVRAIIDQLRVSDE